MLCMYFSHELVIKTVNLILQCTSVNIKQFLRQTAATPARGIWECVLSVEKNNYLPLQIFENLNFSLSSKRKFLGFINGRLTLLNVVLLSTLFPVGKDIMLFLKTSHFVVFFRIELP